MGSSLNIALVVNAKGSLKGTQVEAALISTVCENLALHELAYHPENLHNCRAN